MGSKEAGHGSVDTVINTLDIHSKDPIPVRFRHLAHQTHKGDARVADENIHGGDLGESSLHGSAVGHIAADSGGTGGLCHLGGGRMLLFVEEVHPVTQARKQRNRCGTDAPAAAGNHNS